MKDYTYLYGYIKDSKDDNFIKNYEYKDNEIIVNQLNNKQYSVSRTTEEEQKILDKMKEQYYKIKCVYDVIKQRLDLEISSFLYCLVFVIGLTIFSSASLFKVEDFSYIFILSTFDCLSIIVDVAIITKVIKTKIILKDFIKNKLFVENEEVINKSLDDKNILNNTNTKTKEIINEVISNNSEVTINTIDKIKLEELKQILKNIQNESLESVIESSKVKTKK